MTVERLRREISQEEMLHWSIYFGRKAQMAELAAMKTGR